MLRAGTVAGIDCSGAVMKQTRLGTSEVLSSKTLSLYFWQIITFVIMINIYECSEEYFIS